MLIDFTKLSDDNLFELYRHRVAIGKSQTTESEVANQFIKDHCDELSSLGQAFIPFGITEEIARRWVADKYNYLV